MLEMSKKGDTENKNKNKTKKNMFIAWNRILGISKIGKADQYICMNKLKGFLLNIPEDYGWLHTVEKERLESA